jgi:hypothetical protein
MIAPPMPFAPDAVQGNIDTPIIERRAPDRHRNIDDIGILLDNFPQRLLMRRILEKELS